MKVSIIGIGRLGGALALALSEESFEIESLIARDREKAKNIADLISPPPQILSPEEQENIASEIIFIATQDFEIENAAENLAEKLQNKPVVFHTSGALSSEILQSLKSLGCAVGSLHPLVSISDSVLGKERFRNAYFCIEGDAKAVEAAENIVEKLGGNSFSIGAEYKTLYHAAAVMAAGHLVALIDTAIEALSKCGLSKTQSQKILLPLVESGVENLKTQTPSEALTGTFARADVETLKKHIKALRENVSEKTLETYLQLGERSTHLAEQRGASASKLSEMRDEIMLAKRKIK